MKTFSKLTPTVMNSIFEEYGDSFVFLHHTGYMFGMGCLTSSQRGLQKIADLKKRSSAKGFVVLIPEILNSVFTDDIHRPERRYVNAKLTPRQQLLIQQYWPGNLTVCVELEGDISEYKDLLLDNHLALRCPKDELLRKFIKLAECSVVSTSINESNQPPYDSLEDIQALNWFDFSLLSEKSKRAPTNEPHYSTIISFNGHKLECLREGTIPYAEIEKSYQEPLILFVCTGNICRSPMAEHYARHLFKERGLPFRTASTGVFASGYSISAYSERMLNTDGITARKHRSMKISEDIIDSSALIFAMDTDHKNVLLDTFPHSRHKIYTLAEYCQAELNISDPFTQNIGVYKDTYELIKRYVHKLTDLLEERLNK